MMKKRSDFNKIFDYSLRTRLFISIILIAIIIIGFIIFKLFLQYKSCDDISCYKNALKKCDRVHFIKDNQDSIWRYSIISNKNTESCLVKVKLLRFVNGDIRIESLEGKSMTCNVLKSGIIFPEEDISQCSGELKEELQELIIQKMHNYLIENLGDIKKDFSALN